MVSNTFGGRPAKPLDQLRDQRVVTFLTREESRMLRRIADDEGCSLSQACHDLIVQGMYPGGLPGGEKKSKQRG